MTPKRSILVALLGFWLAADASVVIAGGNVPSRISQGNPVIEICHLIKHPSQYAGKIIWVKGVLVENHMIRVDGAESYLYGPACRKAEFGVLVEWSTEEGYGPMEVFSKKPDANGTVRTRVILVGKFHYSGIRKYGHLDWADSKFIVDKVEEVKSTSATTPRPRRSGS